VTPVFQIILTILSNTIKSGLKNNLTLLSCWRAGSNSLPPNDSYVNLRGSTPIRWLSPNQNRFCWTPVQRHQETLCCLATSRIAPAFSRQNTWLRANKSHASYKAVSTVAWQEQHLFKFTDPGVQHSLLLFRLGSPPLFHLLHLSLVLNLVRWHFMINKMAKTDFFQRLDKWGCHQHQF